MPAEEHAHERAVTPTPRAVLCPYCGEPSFDLARCGACGGRFDPLSRQASQNAMGPWFLRDQSRPHRPGCSLSTLKQMVSKGAITRASVLRGPTTNQFWTPASRTPGVAHLLGVCHSCSAEVSPESYACPSCGASFDAAGDRQHLGLMDSRALPGEASATRIAVTQRPGIAPVREQVIEPTQIGVETDAPRFRVSRETHKGSRVVSRVAFGVFFVFCGIGIAVGGWTIRGLVDAEQAGEPANVSADAQAAGGAGSSPGSQNSVRTPGVTSDPDADAEVSDGAVAVADEEGKVSDTPPGVPSLRGDPKVVAVLDALSRGDVAEARRLASESGGSIPDDILEAILLAESSASLRGLP